MGLSCVVAGRVRTFGGSASLEAGPARELTRWFGFERNRVEQRLIIDNSNNPNGGDPWTRFVLPLFAGRVAGVADAYFMLEAVSHRR